MRYRNGYVIITMMFLANFVRRLNVDMDSYQVPEKTKQITQYDMIQMHTDLPDFPHYRTGLLYIFLDNSKQSNVDIEIRELFSLVTSLVQMGLDTHDMVDIKYDPAHYKQSRANQLRVLAGDYLSSRFYQLLANKGQVDIIQQLSVEICEVNRLKMNLYSNETKFNKSDPVLLNLLTLIKIQLYTPFSQYMQEGLAEKWSDLLYSFTYGEVIVEQLMYCEANEDINILNDLLHQQIKGLKGHIIELNNKQMIKELLELLEPLYKYLDTPQVLEEI